MNEKEKCTWNKTTDKLPQFGELVLLDFGKDILGNTIIETGRLDCNGNWYSRGFTDVPPVQWCKIPPFTSD
jgi:hypothetical protein